MLSIFREILSICCHFISHIFTSFGGFILVFDKMSLIFLGVKVVFTVSSFEF